MGMDNFQKLTGSEKKQIFEAVSDTTGIPAFAVEKDWWVTKTLALIFDMEVGKHLVFKGGTSLSKAWKLIERFSEDVDLAIDRSFFGFEGDLSKNQRTQLRKTAGTYVSEIFLEDLKTAFLTNGIDGISIKLIAATNSDQDPRIIEIYYPNVIPTSTYVEPRVQVEIGSRSLREPFTIQKFGSLVDETFTGREFTNRTLEVPTVNAERTFLEKVFLLHEEFNRPKDKIRVERLSRHLYDIYYLSKTGFAEKAINDKQLYETIVQHRHTFTRVGGVDYNSHNPTLINPIPPSDIIDAWRKDYKEMLESMIYEQNPPTFDELIENLQQLIYRLKKLPWEYSLKFT
jgi:hypothetical protein